MLAEHRRANHAIDQVQGELLFGQQHFHHLVAVHRNQFQQVLAGRLHVVDHLGRNGFAADGLAVVAVEIQGLFAEQVNNPLEIVLQTDRKLHQHGITAELAAELLDHFLRVAAGAVHLVDERQAWHAIAPHLAVDGQRLGLHAAHRAEDENGPVQDAETALDLDGKIDVARGIDQVDVVAVPLHRGRRTGNRDAALPLQVHVVHGGAGPAALDFLHAMDPAGIEEYTLTKGSLSRIDVGRNADVTEFTQVHVSSCQLL